MAILPTDIRILFINYDIIAYFLNLASCSEHFISIKHRILTTFNIIKQIQFWQPLRSELLFYLNITTYYVYVSIRCYIGTKYEVGREMKHLTVTGVLQIIFCIKKNTGKTGAYLTYISYWWKYATFSVTMLTSSSFMYLLLLLFYYIQCIMY
jgi:hypothetical protein